MLLAERLGRAYLMPRKTKTNEITKTSFPINPSTLEMIDYAVYNYVNDAMNIHCDTNKGFKKVPVLFSTQERAHMIKDNVNLRDKQTTLIFPMIAVERSSVTKDPGTRGIYAASVMPHADEKGGSIQIARRVQQEKTRDRANADSIRRSSTKTDAERQTFPIESKKVVYETISIPQPIYVDVSYSITVTTEYVQQMNEIVSPFLARTGAHNSFRAEHEGNKYEAFIQPEFSQDNNAGSLGEDERKFSTSLTIKVLGYIIGEDKNQEQPFVVVRESAAEVKFKRERVMLQDELDFYMKEQTGNDPNVFRIVDKKNKLVP